MSEFQSCGLQLNKKTLCFLLFSLYSKLENSAMMNINIKYFIKDEAKFFKLLRKQEDPFNKIYVIFH